MADDSYECRNTNALKKFLALTLFKITMLSVTPYEICVMSARLCNMKGLIRSSLHP